MDITGSKGISFQHVALQYWPVLGPAWAWTFSNRPNLGPWAFCLVHICTEGISKRCVGRYDGWWWTFSGKHDWSFEIAMVKKFHNFVVVAYKKITNVAMWCPWKSCSRQMRAWVWMLKAEAANKCLRPRMLGAFFRSISHGYFARETILVVFLVQVCCFFTPKSCRFRGQFECFLSRCRRDLTMSVLVTRLTAADCGWPYT